MKTWPSLRLSRPARQCISVDLPDPDGPITAVNRAFTMSRLTSSRARTAVGPVPYCLMTWTARAATGGAVGDDVVVVGMTVIVRAQGALVVAPEETLRLRPPTYDGGQPSQPGRTSPDS